LLNGGKRSSDTDESVKPSSAGIKNGLVLISAGAASGLAMPPIGLWPLLFLTIPALLHHLQKRVVIGSGFRAGWLFGFGYFTMALHWIGFAFLIDAATYLWMMPFAVLGLAAVLALYWGLACATTVAAQRFQLPSFVIFPVALALAEWLRGHLLTGFPWAVPGLAVERMGSAAQAVSFVGMTGMTLVVLLWAAAPFAVWQSRSVDGLCKTAIILSTLPAVWLVGGMRETAHPVTYVDGVMLRLVQPNISQDDKWRADHASRIFDDLLRMSSRPASYGARPTHIIWPESAIPFLIDESKAAQQALASTLGNGQILLAGAIRRSRPDPTADYFTSILVFDHDAKVLAFYDKWRLVPGGEYLPLTWLLEPLGIQKLVSLPGSFVPGTGPVSIATEKAGFAAPIICYEVIFPDRLVDQTQRPDWIVNVTNDGWFGFSVGPYQHLAQARLRAIEQGLPLVRTANTGISAVFDPVGRPIAKTSLGDTSIIESKLPKPLPPTFYATYGDKVLLMAGLFLAAFSWLIPQRLR
jgi:apolipoprotein N-acyltransferase